jgi:hypothetical protein
MQNYFDFDITILSILIMAHRVKITFAYGISAPATQRATTLMDMAAKMLTSAALALKKATSFKTHCDTCTTKITVQSSIVFDLRPAKIAVLNLHSPIPVIEPQLRVLA